MSKLEGGQRLGEGLTASRKRYIQRAETLLRDGDFAVAILELRRAWNEAYPAYAINRATDMGDAFPLSLYAAMKVYALDKNPLADPPEDPRERERFFTVWGAALAWTMDLHVMGERYFPLSDYEPPHDPRMGRPETNFICAAIAADKLIDLVGHASGYFPSFELRYYSPAGSLTILLALRDPEVERQLVEGLAPHFPYGLTASDIRKWAASLAQQKNDHAPYRTPWAKVRASLKEGLSKPEIARRFGYPLETIRDVTKGQRSRR